MSTYSIHFEPLENISIEIYDCSVDAEKSICICTNLNTVAEANDLIGFDYKTGTKYGLVVSFAQNQSMHLPEQYRSSMFMLDSDIFQDLLDDEEKKTET